MPDFQKFKVWGFRLEFDATGEFRDFADRVLRNMTAPNVESFILRRAMLMIILPVVREAYLRGMPKAVDMHVVLPDLKDPTKGRTIHAPRATDTQPERTLRDIYERLRKAQLRGDGDAVAAVQEE